MLTGSASTSHCGSARRSVSLPSSVTPALRKSYASVRTRGIVDAIDPDYVKRRAGDQLFSALAARYLP